jgi:hypothetical protein
LSRKRESIVSSVRIPRDVSQIIRKDAEASDLSFNALVLKILFKYVEWDRFTQKIGFVCIPREMLRVILDATNQQRLDVIAESLASSYKESLLLWFKEINVRTFLEFFRIASHYSGLLEYDLRSEGNDYIITVHHQLGAKWSHAYPKFASEMFKSCLGVEPIIEVGKNHAVIRFTT